MTRATLFIVSVLLATAACATPEKPCLIGGKTINALMAKSDAGEKLSAEEEQQVEAFKGDTRRACKIRQKAAPVCTDGGGDAAPKCSSLTKQQLQVVQYSKDGMHYSASEKEITELNKMVKQLEERWADK